MAYTENYTTAEVTILGITGILLINLFQKIKIKIQQQGILTQYISAYGWNFFGNDVFYYLAVKYIPVIQESCF
jgi:threonine/homoserine efflux transporter RhtA